MGWCWETEKANVLLRCCAGVAVETVVDSSGCCVGRNLLEEAEGVATARQTRMRLCDCRGEMISLGELLERRVVLLLPLSCCWRQQVLVPHRMATCGEIMIDKLIT